MYYDGILSNFKIESHEVVFCFDRLERNPLKAQEPRN